MKRHKDTEPAAVAAEIAHTAADHIGPAIHSAADRLAPLAQSAADRLGPYAEAAADKLAPYTDRIAPYAERAQDRLSPYAERAADRLGPLAHEAKVRGAHAAAGAVDRLGPVLDDALDKVSPAVDAARDRLNDDLLPKLSDLLHQAAGAPVVAEVAKRGKATAASLRGELEVPRKKKSRWLKRLAVIAVIGGAAVVIARKLLGSRDDQWEAPAPASWTSSSAEPQHASGWSAGTDSSAGPEVTETSVSADTTGSTEPASLAADQSAETRPVADTQAEGMPMDEADTEAQTAGKRFKEYGEGSYVGDEPPEGYTIKGNERSMKYHAPESSGYGRTIAEVWFNSEEAAEAAGFTKAQR